MLATAILLAASLLIASGTRGEDALWPLETHPPGSAMLPQQREKVTASPLTFMRETRSASPLDVNLIR